MEDLRRLTTPTPARHVYRRRRRRCLVAAHIAGAVDVRSVLLVPEKPLLKLNHVHSPPPSPSPSSSFHEKLLFLDSLGVDLSAAAAAHPPAAAAPFSTVRDTVHAILSAGVSAADLRRAVGICPELLSSSPRRVSAVVEFLLAEAGVARAELPHVLHRRPRLLVSSVDERLRPTLHFLRSLGVSPVSRHADLLAFSVDDKLLPRIDFLRSIGLSADAARAAVRRFPQIFACGIDTNLRPKAEFLTETMRRTADEIADFPEYFSYALDRRIAPRHAACAELGVRMPLPAMLKPGEEKFQQMLECCVGSSAPFRSSPLWHAWVVGDGAGAGDNQES